jgi:pimeloyl-ACP methyl ester carboxylesterase
VSVQARARTRFATSDGTVLATREDGDGTDGAPTVVLLHGWTQDLTCWDRVVQAMRTAAPDERILRYDHRGHGHSAPAREGSATLEQLADDLAELLADRAPDGPLMLAGHSMGGMTIMAAAERHPGLMRRVAGVALISTSCGGLSGVTLGLPAPVSRALLRVRPGPDGRIARSGSGHVGARSVALWPVLRGVFGKHPRRVDVTDAARQAARAHPGSLVRCFDALLAHERAAVLPSLTDLPCVIMVGTRDPLTPPSHAAALADALPSAAFVRFPEAGHMLPVERGVEVAAELTALVRRVGEASRV